MAKTKEQYVHNALDYLLEPELINEIIQNSSLKDFKIDSIIIQSGDNMKFIPIVLEGSIKITRENENGDELLLYYIEGGDTCAMTLQCCVRKQKSEVRATTMEESKMLMIPIEMMEIWLNKYKSWREFILQSYHSRMMELIETIDAVTFMKLDERLMKYLKDQAKLLGSLEIQHTHQQIAEDLHSSRVVISRLLKQLEDKKLLKIQRNKIILFSI